LLNKVLNVLVNVSQFFDCLVFSFLDILTESQIQPWLQLDLHLQMWQNLASVGFGTNLVQPYHLLSKEVFVIAVIVLFLMDLVLFFDQPSMMV